MSANSAVADDIQRICHELGLAPSTPQLAALAAYVDLLQRWNGTYNLSAVRDRAAILTQHLADCLALIPPLQRHCDDGRLLDVGSGGGLPGVVIAVMLQRWQVTCVDAVAKKVAFIRQVAGALPLANLRAEHARVEHINERGFEVVTARAFASLANFVTASRRQLAPQGVWIAMKGKLPTEEMAALPAWAQVFHVEPLTVPGLASQRCLIWIRQTPVPTA